MTPSCPWCFEREAKPKPGEKGRWLCPCGKTFGVTEEDQREAREIEEAETNVVDLFPSCAHAQRAFQADPSQPAPSGVRAGFWVCPECGESVRGFQGTQEPA